jgi:glycosyltransferase involved in cell wall biosynthesis
LKIVILGTANPYRGGLATFNERLALEFQNQGHDVTIFNFSLQYPNFLFPGTSQFLETPHTDIVPNVRKVNSINPLNWIKVGFELYRLRADVVIFRYWISFMAPCYFVIASILKMNRFSKIFTIVDNAISHEPKFYEKTVARLFFLVSDFFLTMSEKVRKDLASLTTKPSIVSVHPLYDSYSPPRSKSEARTNLDLPLDQKIILFFGFIRDYKGLDLLLEAMSSTEIKAQNIKLVVAGEFYANREKYESMVSSLRIEDQLYWHTDFIPDAKIADYFSAADAVVLPYKASTQSGVTQIAFYYDLPIIATNVGGIKEMVENNIHGLIVNANAQSISNGILHFYDDVDSQTYRKNIARDKSKYSWAGFVEAILKEAKKLPG